MQETPRLQHYVPQFLLKQFAAADGKLWAYDAEKQKMFRAGPKGLAAEGYFYGPTTAYATKQSTAIETWLAEEIESPGADAIAGILEKRKLTGQQASAFFRFVAAQMQRTPTSLQRAADLLAPVFQESAERMAKHDPEFRKNVIARVKATGATDTELAEFIQILDEGKFSVTPTRGFAIGSAFRVLELITNQLTKMCWTFLDVHPADSDLLLGDHPVTLADVGPEGIPVEALGIKNPNIEIALPLSPRMVALSHWDGPISYGQLMPGMAEMLNERTLSQIQRFAYASFESIDLLKRAIALRGTGPKIQTRRVQIGGKLLMITEYR